MKVVYIGYFMMPDGTAAAQLVRGMAKISITAGYKVVIIDIGTDAGNKPIQIEKYLLDEATVISIRYPKSKSGELKKRFSFKYIRKYIPTESVVVFYNYSSVVMLKSLIFKKRGCVNIPLITEWYSPKESNGSQSKLEYLIKKIDIDLRMNVVSKMAPGIIVASRLLDAHYKGSCKTLIIPSVINYEQKKWYQKALDYNQEEINFVYAGSTGVKKDNLSEIIRIIDSASQGKAYRIRIVGVSKEDFLKTHAEDADVVNNLHCIFMGRLPHEECIQVIISSDYSILYRENNRVSNAGFPTKFAESMACGIPQIVTDTSDIRDYIEEGINGVLLSFNNAEAIEQIKEIFSNDRDRINQSKEYTRKMKLFDYHIYVEPMKEFFNDIVNK